MTQQHNVDTTACLCAAAGHTSCRGAKGLHVAVVCLLSALLVAGELSAAEPPQAGAARHRANRLAKETSPYLLLHAHNPVDWYPWGPEALAKAKEEKKLIFLSIGYSSCYWCHVMERESFMDDEIAGLLNKHFVCIKVDREERPDIDEIYMTALQLYYQALGSRAAAAGRCRCSSRRTPSRSSAAPTFRRATATAADGFLTVLDARAAVLGERPRAGRSDRRDADRSRAPDAGPQAQSDRGACPRRPCWTTCSRPWPRSSMPATAASATAAANEQRPKFPEPSNLVFLLDRVRRERATSKARSMLLATLDEDGGRRHPRSSGRRLPSLQHRSLLARAALREDALRQRPVGLRLCRSLQAHRPRRLSPGGRGDPGLRRAGDDFPGRRASTPPWMPRPMPKKAATTSGTRRNCKQALSAEEFDLLAELYGFRGQPNFEERYVLLLDELAAERGRAPQAHAPPSSSSARRLRGKSCSPCGRSASGR